MFSEVKLLVQFDLYTRLQKIYIMFKSNCRYNFIISIVDIQCLKLSLEISEF